MNKLKKVIMVGAAVALFAFNANAAKLDTDLSTNVIMGTGIGNGGWAVSQQDNGVELGLRAKTRLPVPLSDYPNDGGKIYSFETGGIGSRPWWNFEWSINSNVDGTGGNLNDYTYRLQLDSDPSAVRDSFGWDVINGVVFADHSIGTNATAQSGGTEATTNAEYAALIDNNNVAQNSWSQHWFDAGFDLNAPGLYDFGLTAYDGDGNRVANTRMQVSISAVPVPAALPLFGAALLGMAFLARRKKKPAVV